MLSTRLRHASLIAFGFILSGLGLAACEQEASPPAPPEAPATQTETAPDAPSAQLETPPALVRAVPLPEIGPSAQTTRTAEIDWESARADLQASSSGTFSIQSTGDTPADVPVLLPTGIVIAQNADSGPVYRRTADGYFAFYPGTVYNIIVNGTNQTVSAHALPKTNAERAPVFTANSAGAQVWLSRYGADYTVEFECNALEDEEASCIEEEEAMEIASNLIVTGSR